MRFVITTGGTLGHIYPAFKAALELKNKGHELKFLGTFTFGIEKLKKYEFEFINFKAYGLTKGSIFKKIRSIFSIIKACFSSIFILNRYKPDAVIGFGGYGAFGVVLAAFILRIPILIHEQNVVPGRANALLANLAEKIAISFKQTNKYINSKKTVLTGCPSQISLWDVNKEQIIEDFGLIKDKKTILIFGGSQGSSAVNKIFLETIKTLKLDADFQVIHISGTKDFQVIKEEYQQLNIPFAVFEFLDRMTDAYSISDLVISRAGAVTVSELALFRLPAILIPYPYAGGHQTANANVLKEVNLAEVIEEKDLTPQKLKDAILMKLKKDPRSLIKEEEIKSLFFKDSALRIAEEAEKLAGR